MTRDVISHVLQMKYHLFYYHFTVVFYFFDCIEIVYRHIIVFYFLKNQYTIYTLLNIKHFTNRKVIAIDSENQRAFKH